MRVSSRFVQTGALMMCSQRLFYTSDVLALNPAASCTLKDNFICYCFVLFARFL